MKTIKRLVELSKRVVLGLTLGMLLVGCTPEEEEEVKDCNCDRVAYIISEGGYFGMPDGSSFTTPSKFITINDCTGVQLTKTGYKASIGQCR